jgi:hypothetical protein
MPRPVPTRGDATARRFLDAAAQLIDATFVSSVDNRPPRLRSLAFPAALEWLRIEDVVRLAHGEGASRKAFHNRWETKDEFIRDAVIHTMLYRDGPGMDPTTNSRAFADAARLAGGSLSGIIMVLADELLEALLQHPRSFLLMHVGPVLAQHPELHASILDRLSESRRPWYEGYGYLLTTLGLQLRPGWTIERIGMALTAMLDGFLLRSRLQGAELQALRWENASLFADTIAAFILGVVDDEAGGVSVRAALDAAGHIG